MDIINNKKIISQHSKSFFWASRFLPRDVLGKVINIYSYCRLHDDIVDEGKEITESEKMQDLKDIIQSYGVSQEIIQQLIDGIYSDKNFQRFKNTEELIRYCYKVAGVVGLMMTKALNINNDDAKYYAIDLGIAMQLTNISRDVIQDYKKQRIYLPKDTGILDEDVCNLNYSDKIKLKKVIHNLLIKSDIYYNSALNGLRYIPIRSRLSILIALRMYQSIGKKIKKTNIEFLEENIYITVIQKLLILINCIFEFIIFFILPTYSKKHNSNLHKFLKGLPDVNFKKI